jgi:hypothetical protein
MDSIIENDDENYDPTEPNYYRYNAIQQLYSTVYELLDGAQTYKVNICAFEVDNQYKQPFLKYLLYKNKASNKCQLPPFNITRDTTKDIMTRATTVLNKLLVNLAQAPEQFVFNGFKVLDNNIYMFFDVTKCMIKHVELLWSTNNIWFAIIDELVNTKTICNIPIDECATNLFLKTHELCYLQNRQNEKYIMPIIAYVARDEAKLHFTFVFGVSKSLNSSILGAYYYFTNYKNALITHLPADDEPASNVSQNLFSRGIVRFALFIEKPKMIQNLPNDPIDNSEIKKERERGNNLGEELLNRISDHNGTWTTDYDSAYIGNILLDDGNYLKNTPIVVVRDYEQQVSLSYHYITNNAII